MSERDEKNHDPTAELSVLSTLRASGVLSAREYAMARANVLGISIVPNGFMQPRFHGWVDEVMFPRRTHAPIMGAEVLITHDRLIIRRIVLESGAEPTTVEYHLNDLSRTLRSQAHNDLSPHEAPYGLGVFLVSDWVQFWSRSAEQRDELARALQREGDAPPS